MGFELGFNVQGLGSGFQGFKACRKWALKAWEQQLTFQWHVTNSRTRRSGDEITADHCLQGFLTGFSEPCEELRKMGIYGIQGLVVVLGSH